MPEKHKKEDEYECGCCTHISKYGVGWDRERYCKNGEKCINTLFPEWMHYRWAMAWRCVVPVGMGVPVVDAGRFKLFINDIYNVPKDQWLDIFDEFTEYLADYERIKKLSGDMISLEDVEMLENIEKEENGRAS